MAKGQVPYMFGTLGGPELFLIFVVALIVFGPRKLPEIGKSLGRMMSEFRRASNEFRSTIESEVESEKIKESMRIEAPKVKPVKARAPSPDAGRGDGDISTKEATPGDSPVGAGPADEAAPAGNVAPAPEAGPAADPAPETVSRQPPAPTGEQK